MQTVSLSARKSKAWYRSSGRIFCKMGPKNQSDCFFFCSSLLFRVQGLMEIERVFLSVGKLKAWNWSSGRILGMGGFLYVCKVLKFRSSISNTRRECKELAILVTNCLPLHSDFQKLLPEAAAKDLAQWL